jgi:hypothetical protein
MKDSNLQMSFWKMAIEMSGRFRRRLGRRHVRNLCVPTSGARHARRAASTPAADAGHLAKILSLMWIAILLPFASGYWMVFKNFGGFAGARVHIHMMQIIGWR